MCICRCAFVDVHLNICGCAFEHGAFEHLPCHVSIGFMTKKRSKVGCNTHFFGAFVSGQLVVHFSMVHVFGHLPCGIYFGQTLTSCLVLLLDNDACRKTDLMFVDEHLRVLSICHVTVCALCI